MSSEKKTSSISIGCGCMTPGSIIAAILSWAANHSIGWMIVHAIFGWFYVVYWIVCRSNLMDWVEKLVK